MVIKSYRDLIVWQKAMDLVEVVYKMTQSFPNEECYGLTSQIRRAAVSVPSNIAEGHSRKSSKEFLHYLSIAYGSLGELETQIQIAQRLTYLQKDEAERLLEKAAEVGRLSNGLSRSLTNRPKIADY